AQLGVKFEFLDDPFSADLILCESAQVPRLLQDPARPPGQFVIAVESGDSASVFTEPAVLRHPAVLAAVKHHVWKPRWPPCPTRPISAEGQLSGVVHQVVLRALEKAEKG
ncbi:unnamed protein product, partial [Polarella glacialis]